MPEQVPKEVVQERFDRLLGLQQAISLEKARAQVGTEAEVLVEGAGPRRSSTQSRTRANRIVHLAEPLDPGTFVTARITDAAAHHLCGEVVPAPAHV
jgi:tRNA-2-methylthio-N6-dimethylallyladenosine synthase